MDESRLYVELRCSSIEHYLQKKLGFKKSSAWSHKSVSRALPELPRLREAFANAKMTWSTLREVASVATSRTEQLWIDCLAKNGADVVDREVRAAKGDGRDAPSDGEYSLPAHLVKLTFALTAVEMESTAVDAATQNATVINIAPEEERPLAPLAGNAEPDGETSPEMRAKVLARDGHRCQSCRGRRDLHAHHVQPRSEGGRTELDNLVTTCKFCHGLLYQDRLVVTGSDQTGFEFS